MVELNHRDRTIKVKLVYYGPPVGGKTTNLQILHRCADAKRRGELISINSAQDRTILFDLLPLKTPGFRGFDLRLQVLAVPGQAMYSATRRLVLKGADALVFVANSALDRWEENIQSYREMTQNLLSHHLDPTSMPLVFQYNKRDLPQVLEIEALDRALNGRRAEVIPAVAVRGEGVLETFGIALARTVQDLASRYAILDVKEGAPARQWAEQALMELFGRTRLAFDAQASPVTRPMPRAEPGDVPVARRHPAAPSRRPHRHPGGAAALPARGRPSRREPRREGERSRRDLRRGLRPAGLRPHRAARGTRRRAPAPRGPSKDHGGGAGAARRHAARSRTRSRARAHGPHRGRRARGLLGPAGRPAAPRGHAPRAGLRPRARLSRGPAPRLGERHAGSEAGLRLRRGEPRPRPRARARRKPLRGAARRALPHPGRAAGAGRLLLRAGHRAAGPGGDRPPRRDPACPVRRPRAGGDARAP